LLINIRDWNRNTKETVLEPESFKYLKPEPLFKTKLETEPLKSIFMYDFRQTNLKESSPEPKL